MKKILLFFLTFMLVLTTGCGKEANIEGDLSLLMDKIYAGIKDEEKPMMLMNTEVTSENVEYYLGNADIEFESAIASEPGIGSIPHSVVLVRAKKGQDVEKLKKTIKENVNPNKWICVSVEEENVIVDSIGDLVILIMNNSYPETLHNNFKNLK